MTTKSVAEIKADIMANNTIEAWERNMRPPTPEECEKRKTRELAALRQQIWETAQFVDYVELADFCDGVLEEIRSDDA